MPKTSPALPLHTPATISASARASTAPCSRRAWEKGLFSAFFPSGLTPPAFSSFACSLAASVSRAMLLPRRTEEIARTVRPAAAQGRVWAAKERKTGDDCKTTKVDVLLAEDGTVTWAYREDVYVVPNSMGGDTSGVQIPFTVYNDGNRVAGTFNMETKAFTPNP